MFGLKQALVLICFGRDSAYVTVYHIQSQTLIQIGALNQIGPEGSCSCSQLSQFSGKTVWKRKPLILAKGLFVAVPDLVDIWNPALSSSIGAFYPTNEIQTYGRLFSPQSKT